ncbi:hypothetical protein COHA_000856 [Chlorella ohadii]|nr:hypothetical protein COHA_000856 [Chlorella ohadii]
MRAEAAAAGEAADGDAAAVPAAEQQQADGQQQEAGEPVLRFRNYAPVADERIQHEKVAPAKVPEFEEVTVDVDAVLGDDPEEVLINVAPKKANWDLRRDIAGSLARLERRTQAAMIKLMQQEEQRRQEEEQQAE